MSNRFFPSYPDYLITSRYGMRTLKGVTKMHNGIDLTATRDGTVGKVDHIMAHTGGTVCAVGYDKSAGNYIKIQVAADTIMVYYHLRETSPCKVGDTVKAGDIIGYMGETGNTHGAHLHWGIKVGGNWIDPAPYLDKDYPAAPAVKYITLEVPVLKRGCKGAAVRALQAQLIGYGYSCGDKGVDGSFGAATEAAVKAYQADNGLAVDGSVGRQTRTSLLGLEGIA